MTILLRGKQVTVQHVRAQPRITWLSTHRSCDGVSTPRTPQCFLGERLPLKVAGWQAFSFLNFPGLTGSHWTAAISVDRDILCLLLQCEIVHFS